jgi:predicted NUDIX family phosphoesterase
MQGPADFQSEKSGNVQMAVVLTGYLYFAHFNSTIGSVVKQEKVLVVAMNHLGNFVRPNCTNVSGNIADFLDTVQKEGRFIPRVTAENDFNFKQVIPYIYISHGGNIYLTNRKSTQSESRLHNKYSLAVGGHINEFDNELDNKLDIEGIENIVQNGMLRELNEEVIVDSGDILEISAKGLISDDTNEVGRVHIGVVYQVSLKSAKCAVNEIDKMDGKWIQLSDIPSYYEELETWSQIIYNYFLRQEHGQ